MLNLKTIYTVILFSSLLTCSNKIRSAELQLQFAQPSWTFLIQNDAVNPRQLLAAENSFVRTLQPLLKAKDYQAVSEKLQHFTQTEQSGAMLLLRGQIALSLQQLTTAKQALHKAIEVEPDLAAAHNALALIYLKDDLFKQALPHLQKTVALGEHGAQATAQLAYVNMQLGYSAAAVDGFRRALYLDAENLQWQQGLLFSLVHAKSLSQALALAEQMLQRDPLEKSLWMLRSQIALQRGNNLQALSSLESALTLGEKSPANIMTAVQLHLNVGSPTRAVELLTHPAILNKSIPAEHQQQFAQIANWLAAEQQWDNLRNLLYRSKVKAMPRGLKATIAIAQARLADHNGNPSETEQHLKQALKLAPTHGEALIEFAHLLKGQQRYTQAKQYYVRAEALTNYREQALLGRAEIAIAETKYADALHLIGKVVKQNPARTDLVSTINTLKNLATNSI